MTDNDDGVFAWMYDRGVLPHSLGQACAARESPQVPDCVRKFYGEHVELTEFVWPKEWDDVVCISYS